MYRETVRIWDSAKNLFHPKRVEAALKQEMKNAEVRLGVLVFLAAALLTAILTVAIMAESLYAAAYEYNIVSDMIGAAEVDVDWGALVPFTLFQFLFIMPFGLAFSLVYEGIVYKLMRVSGGKGTFSQQYYLSSLVALSLAMSIALGLLGPVPCLRLFVALAIIVLALYFTFFVNVKAYRIVHDISFLHAFVIVVLLAVPRILVVMYVVDAAAGLFSMPEFLVYDMSGV